MEAYRITYKKVHDLTGYVVVVADGFKNARKTFELYYHQEIISNVLIGDALDPKRPGRRMDE